MKYAARAVAASGSNVPITTYNILLHRSFRSWDARVQYHFASAIHAALLDTVQAGYTVSPVNPFHIICSTIRYFTLDSGCGIAL